MPVTIRDIAGKLNVSHATVSRALNGRDDPFISTATRQRVLAAAREMGYVPNRHARALVAGKTYTIGVVGIPLVSDFHGRVAYGIEAECIARGYHALLVGMQHGADNGIRWAIDMLLQHQVDGAILASGAALFYSDIVEALGRGANARMQCVWVDERLDSALADCVYTDDITGAAKAVRHLARLGHTRIAHLAAESQLSTSRDRLSGYLAGLESVGIDRDDALIVEGSYAAERSLLGAAVGQLMGLSRPPTAVLASSDWIAARALQALRSSGLSVPGDVAVVGYGNENFSSLLDLTTVDQDPAEMGLAAARRLFERMADPGTPVKANSLPTELIIRGTCGAAVAP